MNRLNRILLVFATVFILNNAAQAQQKSPVNINDVFLDYVAKTLELKPAEAVQIKPLVKKYLNGRKKIYGKFSDPLEREQQILNLKLSSRKDMAAIIGMEKANAFFSSEQLFRRKVREELKQRDHSQKKN